ncbi:MAG: hypothetical protein ABSH56_29500 [Bryobacteraceae bacterium]|jgi:hypothetical protein
MQELHLQIHGNLAEGVLYGSGNNYLTADTTDGTAKWDDGSLSVTSAVTDKFRVGAQVHSWALGELGRNNVELDWAYGDYKFNSWFGIRAGQVKTPFGLYNEVQDVDAVTPWALLPQSVYPSDMRSFTLSHLGGVLYGDIGLGKRAGTLSWSAFGGRKAQRQNEGFVMTMASMGISLGDCTGTIEGADVRWKAPVDGLQIGAAFSNTDLSAPHASMSSWPVPLSSNDQQRKLYSEYEKGKVTLSAEWTSGPDTMALGLATIHEPVRSWYTMASYHLTNKLTAGSYYSHERLFPQGGSGSNPANYLQDVTASTRYDFNRFFYAKLEAHYMDGNALGFYE